MKGSLYVVATPIGNLGDITLRALDVLKSADVVAAEDTRTTSVLLNHYAISTRLISLHKHNEKERCAAVLDLLKEGRKVVLVSDAGTPAISDPGALLVQAAREAGFDVSPIPGANAAIAALCASGLSEDGFLFAGFLPSKSSARKKALDSLKDLPFSLVFFEAPHRIIECAKDLAEILGGQRRAVFAREITKRFETIHSCSLLDAQNWLETQARGEFVVVVEGARLEKLEGVSEEGKRVLEILLESVPLAQAVKLASKITGEGKNALYAHALIQEKGEE